jgi:sugar lactone lactonase YvrE
LRSPRGLALDGAGRLWVSDTDNHRVVAFPNAATAATGTLMSVVLGQADFGDNGPALAQNRMKEPRGLCIDAAGNLYVADYGNHRVLRFAGIATKTSGEGATAVIGQQDFITASTVSGASLLNNPSGVCTDSQGRLWVADTGKSRVTRYDTPLTSAPMDAPSGILGGSGGLSASTMGQPQAVAVDASGRLFVLDYFFNRILRYEDAAAKANGANADGILGEPTFTNYVLDGRTRRTTRRSVGLFLDAAQNLWLADDGNARLVRFSPLMTAYITQLNPTATHYAFTFHGEAGIPYTVKSSTDLKNWQTEQSFNLAAPGLQVFSKAKDGAKRFYRIEEP